MGGSEKKNWGVWKKSEKVRKEWILWEKSEFRWEKKFYSCYLSVRCPAGMQEFSGLTNLL